MPTPPEESLLDVLAGFPAVRLAVLFGSAARGRTTRKSDLDVGVLLEPETSTTLWEIEGTVGEAVRRPVDLIDLRRAPPQLRFEIVRDGRVLLERQKVTGSVSRSGPFSTGGTGRRRRAASTASPSGGCAGDSTMVRGDVVAQKVAAAQARLAAADPIFAKPRGEFLATEKDRDVAMFYLFLAIQECIDLAAHWVVDEDWGPPEDAGGSFDILRDKGILDADLARDLRAATGLRNRIGHGYGFLDPGRTHDEYPQGSKALRRFFSIAADAAGL